MNFQHPKGHEAVQTSLLPFMQEWLALIDEHGRILALSPALQRILCPEGPPPKDMALRCFLLMGQDMPLVHDERWRSCQLRDVRGQLYDLEIQITLVSEAARQLLVRFRQPDQGGMLNHALLRIYWQTSHHVGQAYLDETVRQLCRELVVEGAFVAEADECRRFQLRASYLPTQLPVRVHWLNEHAHSMLDRGVRLEAQTCGFLADEGVDILKTVPLRSGDGSLYGVLGIVDSDRHSLPVWTEDLMVLVATRCVSELERIRTERRMERLAYFDPLTDLPNRQRFRETVDRLLAAPSQCEGSALLFLDLDRFKQVNDTLGHHFGDRLLQLAARRMSRALDCGCQAYRISGDEFAILARSDCALEQVLEKLEQAFSRPYQIEGHHVQTSVSIGVALWRPEYREAHDWLRDADQAMYVAKRDVQRQVVFFDDALWSRSRGRARIQKLLQGALEREELFIEYQPVLGLPEQRLRGFEALVRWQHPVEGVLGPERFVPLCEESGRIVRLDRWVFSRVCRQMDDWKRSLGEHALLPVNVNVSAIQVTQPDFVDYYLAMLARYDIEPEWIHIEITETALMDDRGVAAANLQALRDQGIQVVVDDFGMGYSSLGRLQQLPVDTLKIDRTFVHEMLDSEDSMEVVWAIVTLAHNLGKRIVAEGIEDRQQLDLLQTMRCDLGQGFLLGRPMSAERACNLLSSFSQTTPALGLVQDVG